MGARLRGERLRAGRRGCGPGGEAAGRAEYLDKEGARGRDLAAAARRIWVTHVCHEHAHIESTGT
jgi:hypothetical protein